MEIGRAIMDGYLPYRDVYYPHPPLLAFGIGVGLQVFGSMYPLRILYLLANLLGVFPLYAVLRKLSDDRLGALFGSLFYLVYHEMVHHDFRFFALRQPSNLLLILFIFTGLFVQHRTWRIALQSVFAACAALLFIPGLLNIGLASLVLIFRERGFSKKRRAFFEHALVGGIAILTIVLLFLTVPRSFERIFFEHLHVSSIGRFARLEWMSTLSWRDLLFYISATAGLVLALLHPRHRITAFCMLAMIGLLFVPNEFWPHYVVSAAVAFATGIAFLPTVFRMLSPRVVHVFAVGVPALLFVFHLWFVAPSLAAEWLGNRQPIYHQIVADLARMPEPVLTLMEPSYAADADRQLVHHEYQAARFLSTLRAQLSPGELRSLGEKACTIFLTDWDKAFVGPQMVGEWKESFATVFDQGGILVLRSKRPECEASFDNIPARPDDHP